METQAAVKLVNFEEQGRNNLFSIKPYKNHLLTPGARYWIVCIHLVILVMATSEAIAWGYLGSLFGSGALGVLAAGITFLFMFLIVWVIDVSFVTLDLSRSYYDKIILKKESERWIENTGLGIGLLGRVAIVFVSLSISAPFLAQIVFKQDVDNEIDRRNMVSVSMIGDSLLLAKDEEIAALDSLILLKEAELIEETAGKGSSGNYGFGPVTTAMEKNINRLQAERAALVQDKIALDHTIQSLSVEEFAGLYNVDLIDNGVRVREEILGGLMGNPEYRTAKTAITAFLAFIFGALVLLKLFQPRSVRIYYNEKLQDLYREYLAGHLNKWIASQEQSINGLSQMSPLRFEDWCVNTYSVVRNEDLKRRDSRKIYNLFKMKLEQLEEEKAEIKKMMEPVEAELEQAIAAVNKQKVKLLEAENEIQHNAREGEEISRQLENISDDLRNHRFQGSDVLIAVSAKKDAELKLAENRNERLALEYNHDLVKHKYEIKDAEAKQVEDSMTRMRENYRNLQEKIDRERIAYTDLIVSGQVVEVPRMKSWLESPEEKDSGVDDRLLMAPEYEDGHAEEPLDEEDVFEGGDERQDEEDLEENEALPAAEEDKAYVDSELSLDHGKRTFNDDQTVNWLDEDEQFRENNEQLPVEFVDDEQLNAYAEAASLADYEQEESEDNLEEDQEDTAEDDEGNAVANDREDVAEDDQDVVEEKVSPDYFVDPALISYSVDGQRDNEDQIVNEEDFAHEDQVAVAEIPLEKIESGQDEDLGSLEAFNNEVKLFLSEQNEPAEQFEEDLDLLEESIRQKIESRSRVDRNGRPIRKGTFGKAFGEGV